MSDDTSPVTLVLIMGVAGCGKTTVGRALAETLQWEYHEADDFHPPENVAKMSRGIPLTDVDRAPWLRRIRSHMEECVHTGRSAVFTCSALRESYRSVLMSNLAGVVLVHLQLDEIEALARVSTRPGHFMKPGMVRSQFEALEPPGNALVLDARLAVPEIVARIRTALGR